jgi:putative heme-binding domain-containing protein
MRAATPVLLSSALGLLLAGRVATAQHATAFDVEDGADAYQNSCVSCHGPDGDQVAGIDLGHGRFRRPLTDAELAGIIMNGIPDTPMPPTPGMSGAQALRIVAYLRSRAASSREVAAGGDAGRGRTIFEGKGRCLDCHRVDGRGSRLGPDLSCIGELRQAAELMQSLLDPAAEVQPTNRFYTVTTVDGERVTGRLLNHDTFTVQLIDSHERLRSFVKAKLRNYGFSDPSMPSYRDTLGAAEVADVVSYLTSLRDPSEP